MKNDLLLQRSLMPIDREETGTDELIIERVRDINKLTAYGKCVQSNLPPKYTELEYLESTGTQWIDTGYKPTNKTRCIARMRRTLISFAIDFGSRDLTAAGNGYCFGIYNVTNYMSDFNGNRVIFTNIIPNTTDIILVDKNRNITTIKDLTTSTEESKTNTDSIFSVNYNLLLFGYTSQGITTGIQTIFYLFKMYEDDVLIRDLVPARRNSDNVLGMYDKVSGDFLVNQGTDDFIAGPDVVPNTPTPSNPIDIWCNNGVLKARHQSGLPLGYTEVEYIKKTSLSYIDSGINQTDSVGVSIDVKFDSYNTGTTYQYAIGAYNSGDYIGVWKMNNSSVSLCFVSFIVSVSSSDNTNFHNFKINYLNSRNFSYDNSKVGDIIQTKAITSPNIYIGDTNYSQHFGNSSFSIKRVRISNETAIVFDGIPAKTTINGTEVVGLYDTVSGTFKTAKAGTFTAGPVVLDPVEIYTSGPSEVIKINNNLTPPECSNLLGIGNYKDSQEVLSGNISKKVGVVVFDGTENWSEKDIYGRVNITIADLKYSTMVRTTRCYCNYFTNLYRSEPITSVVVGDFYTSASNCYFHITQNNVSDFKQWLADQYAAGTPVIIVYPLETPIQETVEGQDIDFEIGTNKVEAAQDDIDGLSFTVRYRQK